MDFTFNATKRVEQGSGASRRLRRTGVTPAVIYGGNKESLAISLDHNELYHKLRNEKFHSSILTVNVEGVKETVVLRDTQWHPYRQLVQHVDFQRIDATQKLHLKVPLHFINAEMAPGVKLGGGIVSHVMNEVDVSCLPADLPEFLEVDLQSLEAGQSIHLSQVKLPAGVELAHAENDPVVAVVVIPRGVKADAAESGDAAEA